MCINQICFISIYTLHVLLFHAVCCRLFFSWVSSSVLPQTAQRSEFCSIDMVQNHSSSWKNEWPEANNVVVYSFFLNHRSAWRDTRTQIDWVAVDKGLSSWRFINELLTSLLNSHSWLYRNSLRIIDLIMDRQSYSDVGTKGPYLDTMFLNYLRSIGMQKQMTV